MSQSKVKILVDADACPVPIKDIIFRAADRTKTDTLFIANHAIKVPNSPFIKRLQVEKGFDQADNEIVRRCQQGDLVVTSDLPLASEVIEKGAKVITSRGEELSLSNIRTKLSMRDFLDTMRASGVHTGGPSAMNAQDKQQFANALDKYLAKIVS